MNVRIRDNRINFLYLYVMDMKKTSLEKMSLQFKFLSNYERFGLVSLLVLLISIVFVFMDVSQNIYSSSVIAICILSLFFVYRIFAMPVNTNISDIVSKTFTMGTTIAILIFYTIFCISNFSDELTNMPSGWTVYVKVFMSLLMVQSIVAVYSLYFTKPNNHWIVCSIGAVLNVLLFTFLLIIYTIEKNFRTDGFLV